MMRCFVLCSLVLVFTSRNHSFVLTTTRATPATTTTTALRLTADLETWRRSSYSPCSDELSQVYELQLPAGLSEGTYYRNGPGKFEVKGRKENTPLAHPLDGDGMVAAVTMVNNTVIFRNRFVGTKGYQKERRSGEVMAKGAFGTAKPGLLSGFDKSVKNPANMNCLYWGKKPTILALWAAGRPYRMEADSLRTFEKEYTIKGVLEKGMTLNTYPKVDTATGRLIAFSTGVVGKPNAITVYEFDEDFTTVKQKEFELPGYIAVQDFSVTQGYYLFHQPPVQRDANSPAALPNGLIQGTGGTIYLVPREGDAPIEVVEVDCQLPVRVCNAYEQGSSIILDCICSETLGTMQKASKAKSFMTTSPTVYADMSYSKLRRYTLNRASSGWLADDGGVSKELSSSCLNNPSINPAAASAKHKFIYCSAGGVKDPSGVESSPMQGIAKIDTDAGVQTEWYPEVYEFLNEPCFVPKEGSVVEDEGYIVTMLNNGKELTTEFVLFDATKIDAGPIVRLPLPVYLPKGQHGTYARGAVFDPEAIVRRFKACKGLDRRGWNEVKGGFSGLGLSAAMDD